MLKRQFRNLENPKRPLLGPNVKVLEFWGLLLPENKLLKCICIMVALSNIIFAGTQCADIWFLRSDIAQLMQNMKYTILNILNLCKGSTFLLWQKDWKAIIEYVTRADLNQRTTMDEKNKLIIKKFTKYCRKLTYLYWFLTYSTGLMIILRPIFVYALSPTYRHNVKNGTKDYDQVINSWMPFDKNTIQGYLLASFIQSYATVYASACISSFDAVAIVIMVFFKGELELLRRDCKNMFGTETSPVSDVVAFARFKTCHKRHVDLIKYNRLFNSCLSPNMFLYIFVCSVILCVTVFQIKFETSVIQRFLAVEYFVFGIAQLFMYCWHSNEIFYASLDLMLGPYESLWWKRSLSRQKDVCILILQFRKTFVITAGPFSDLTLATFINILKGAYSYFTLLSQSQA